MRLISLILLLYVSTSLSAQPIGLTPIAKIERNSWWKAAYKIPVDTALLWLKKETVNFEWLDSQQPFSVIADSLDCDSAFLPQGQYVWLNAKNGNLVVTWQQVSNLSAAITTTNQRLLLVYNKYGELLSNAITFYKNKTLVKNEAIPAVILPTKLGASNLLMTVAGHDTLITLVETQGELWGYTKPKRWRRFPVVRQILNSTYFIKNIIRGNLRLYKNRSEQSTQKRFGYVLFNKPVYKPGDTVKLKAWLTNRKDKPLNQGQELWLNYQKNRNFIHKKLAAIKPITAGSYLYELPLADSLPSDTRYNLEFRGSKKYQVFKSEFKTEDYTLPDISSFGFKSLQEEAMHNDTLHFTAEAKDANGVPLLDASVRVIITSGAIQKFYTNAVTNEAYESVFISDTLFNKTYSLLTNDITKIDVPISAFPAADMQLNVSAELINSSNEVRHESAVVKLFHKQRKVQFEQDHNSVRISYKIDGGEVKRLALISIIKEDDWKTDTLVTLPAIITIHPLATTFEVEVYDEMGKMLDWDEYDIKEEMKTNKPQLLQTSQGDTISFQLKNPNKTPVFLNLLKTNKIVWQKYTNEPSFNYRIAGKSNQLYKLQMRYIIHGEEIKSEINLYLPSKLLQLELTNKAIVEPGENDTLKVQVRDFKNRPVKNVNLTAVGQNTQLKEQMNFPSIPMKYQFRRYNEKVLQPYEVNNPTLNYTETAKPYKSISNKIGLDSMLFYSLLFSNEAVIVHRSVVERMLPEIAVHISNEGKQEPAYIIYVNRQPVWFFGMNAIKAFSHVVKPGYVQVGVRTKNAYWEVDSLYMQPYYKHDIVLNTDALKNRKDVKYYRRPDTLLLAEKNSLRQCFAVFENVPQNAGVLLWQRGIVAKLEGSSTANYIVGPFENNDSISTYKEGQFDFKFPFESGYKYRLSQHLTRMEKTQLLTGRTDLNGKVTHWRLGEILPSSVFATKPKNISKPAYLKQALGTYVSARNTGTLQLQWPVDSLYDYTVLIPNNKTQGYWVYQGKALVIQHLKEGIYQLLAITRHKKIAQWYSIFVREGGSTCVQLSNGIYTDANPLVDSIRNLQLYGSALTKIIYENNPPASTQTDTHLISIPAGEALLTGCLVDNSGGEGIPGVAVTIKGARTGTSTDTKGCFILNVPVGRYTLVFSAVGYLSVEKDVRVSKGYNEAINVRMKMSEMALEEVVVVGYGVSKKNLSGSVSIVANELMGKVAGLNVTENGYDNASILIRGSSSLKDGNNPLFVVDGVFMDEIPSSIDTANVQVEVLKSAIASSIYGNRAANGVIVITTGRNSGPIIRSVFRDDAYWQPNTITDKYGRASIPITYPENITGWQHAIYAAATKGRYGRSFSVTKAFKATQGLISVPQFLVANDTVGIIGKAMNYGSDTQTLHTLFKWNDKIQTTSEIVAPNKAVAQVFAINAQHTSDTIKASFGVQDDKGYADGEERAIPVLPMGSLESSGKFWLLDKDTSIHYQPTYIDEPVVIYAENKLIDLLEKELETLCNYPQMCMEQTANKLWGLLQMRKIKKATGRPFKYDRLLTPLLHRLLKNQLYSGGWAWWESGMANIYITTKVLQSLHQQDSTSQIHQAKRNGFLFLENSLPSYLVGIKNGKAPRSGEYLEAMLCLAEGKHLFNYTAALDTLNFDSLSVHQQWQYVRIKQLSGRSIDGELKKLWSKRKESLTGSLSWGEQSWFWQNNQNSTSVIAYKVLRSKDGYSHLTTNIKQFFLEQKQNGWYSNTVEKAEISALLLQDALDENSSGGQPTQLVINDIRRVEDFPAKIQLPSANYEIKKLGSGFLYVTAFQQRQNANPERVDSIFGISSQIVQLGDTLKGQAARAIKSGVVAQLVVSIEVKKLAEFVQIEIPIPAGCTYAAKSTSSDGRREYLKDKTIIFLEKMEPGKHVYVIQLQPRFTGRFSLNPARAELMYFPTIYGRDNLNRIRIVDALNTQ
jgi:TonB-dependent SusC/RagA subfamily outer membrane receptor